MREHNWQHLIVGPKEVLLAQDRLRAGDQAHSGNADVYASRGDARRLTGDTDGAMADLERAVRLNPKLAGPYYGSGMVRFVKGKLESAIADFTKALSLDARLEHAYANRGLAFLMQGKESEAGGDFRRALALAPGLRKHL